MATPVSNPIQQRMELLLEKWEGIVGTPDIHLIRIHAQENEKDMVGAFHTYLLGTDTGNNDIPIIFESILTDEASYSKDLLNELEEMLEVWNHASSDNLEFEIQPINWGPDYSLHQPENPAFLFIENLNRLADQLPLSDGVHLVLIFKVTLYDPNDFIKWLGFILKCQIHSSLKILIDDTDGQPWFDDFCSKHHLETITLHPDLDMDNAMQQIASMGKPDDPAVLYRKSFVSLMQSIERRKEEDAKKYANRCLDIAVDNLEKNPFWIGQVIAVYTALSNDQIGYRNFKQGILYASEAVEAAENSDGLIGDEYIYQKFLGQTLMLRGALFSTDKQWGNAIDDFSNAAIHYSFTKDYVLAIEAYRMLGYCNTQNGNHSAACKGLKPALEIGKSLPTEIIRATTFPGVLEMLLDYNDYKWISYEEVKEMGLLHYGQDWVREIRNWKNHKYETSQIPQMV